MVIWKYFKLCLQRANTKLSTAWPAVSAVLFIEPADKGHKIAKTPVHKLLVTKTTGLPLVSDLDGAECNHCWLQ